MHPRIDEKRRELARLVRRMSVEAFHDQLAEAGVTRAYVVWENGEFALSHPKLLEPIQAFFELSQDFAGHEGVFIGREDGVPTLFFAAVHDTRRGLSQGGLRFKPYGSLADVLVDNIRLAQGMTRKNALAGLWWGGGKGVVPMTEPMQNATWRTPGEAERVRMFEAYGRFVASLNGFYYTAEDVGTTTSDMNALHAQNRFTTCIGVEHGGSGNPSPFTARGVFLGMKAGWQYLHQTDDLNGVKVAIQGVGHVGIPLVEALDDAGARVWVSDINRESLEKLKEMRPRIEIVDDLDSIYDLDVDVFAPCAIGAVVNQQTIPRLKVQMVCGAANNILAEPAADAERLRERGIVYMPDYLVNRMGVTNCCDESVGYLQDDVELAAERVYPDALRVLRHAERHQMTTALAADQLADIAAAELHPLYGHRGRRLIDHLIASDWSGSRGRRKEQKTAPLFESGRDEPAIRLRWEREGRFRGGGRSIAAAPISAAGRPDLSSFFSAVLMDVRARALETLDGERPRRVAGSDHGGLTLQMAAERSISYERQEVGRARFTETCQDLFRSHDKAIRQQLHQLGVGFDPASWLDSMSHQGSAVVERLFLTLKDAGLVFRESRRRYLDRGTQAILTAPETAPVKRLRGRSTADLEDHGVHEHLFVSLDEGARHLERAIANGAVTFSAKRWKSRVLKAISEPDPWDVSRRHWWGHPLPGTSEEDPQVLSVWFALVGWTLQAMGWPRQATPEPIDEVYVNPDLLMRWVIPSQVVALQLTGRPAFRRVEVHGALYVPQRVLEQRPDAQPGDLDEERFVVRRKRVRMRRQLGNVVEPATLVQRFGADALRLGYLLASNPGTPEVATWAQSTVRQGRRTVRRLNAKVSGLDQLFGRLETHGAEGEASDRSADLLDAGRLLDTWIRTRVERVVEETHRAYREHRMHDAAQLFVATVDDFGRFSAQAAQRRGAALRTVAVTAADVVQRLADAFSPICPYLFDKLCQRTSARAVKLEETKVAEEKRATLGWVDDLISELGRHRRKAVRLLSEDAAALGLLRDGREELAALTRTQVTVEEGAAPDDTKTFGPVAVVLT